MKIMIAAGGTGGHIYPALALADEIRKKDKNAEVVFFGSSNRMEAKIIPQAGYRFYGTAMSGMNGGLLAKAASAVSLLKADALCHKILKKEKPDMVIGFGNYISVPMVAAAHRMGIKTMLHEQNSYAGKANRFLAKYADGIVGCYASNLDQFPKEKTKILGNPQASAAALTVYDQSEIEKTGLDPEKPFVLIMMGSLGSVSVSKYIDEACSLFDDSYSVVIAAGRSNDYVFENAKRDNIRVLPYVNGRNLLKGCALAVVRAGATTMAEIGAIGTASILIPSPYVPNNHQFHNAMELVDQDAGVLLEEKDLSGKKLAEMVNELMKDEKRRKTLADNCRKCGKPDAADDMVAMMKEIMDRG